MSDKKTLSKITERGVKEILPNKESLTELMQGKKIKLYLGIDPTGSLLHLGHSVVLRKLQQFVDAGHEVMLLIGNGTVRIGDPTGRDSTRPELTDAEIEENFKTWQEQASKVLDFSKIKIVHNGDWLDKLTYAEIVKLMASTTVQQLIERDMFQERIKKSLPIFGHEIMYPLLQGYDSVALDVDLEIGGTDQTFNMMMGRHLQKVYNNREKWVLTTPIINGLDGRKMSKSFNNYIALNEAPNEMYGKMMSAKDEVIVEYFTLLTDRNLEEITEMEKEITSGANPMEFKKLLAHDLVTFYHNSDAADEAAKHFEATVQNKQLPDDMPDLKIPDGEIALQDLVKLAVPDESMSNIRRLIDQGGVELIDSEDSKILRVGKRKFFKLVD